MGEIYYLYEDTSDDNESIPIVYLALDCLDFMNNTATKKFGDCGDRNDR